MKHLAFLAAVFLSACSVSAAEPEGFCTLETATSRFLSAAGITPSKISNQIAVEVIEGQAREMVLEKLAANPGENVRITWADVYRLRGVTNHILCKMEPGFASYFNCAGAVIDAVGEGLTGTAPGKAVSTLALLGPGGFVLTLGMKVTEETFQCEPSMVRMLAHGATDFSVYLPVCRAGVISRACVALENGVKKGAEAAIKGMFGENILKAVKVSGAEFINTTGGQQVVKLIMKPIKGAVKNEAVNRTEGASNAIGNFSRQNGGASQAQPDYIYVPVPESAEYSAYP